MNCEMCGTEAELVTVMVEGVELKVCRNCASFGRPVRKKLVVRSRVVRRPEKEIIEVVIDDFPKIIREKREKMGLKQNEFAKYLAERESLVHKMESGEYVPPLEIARKLEKQLSVKLIEEREVTSKSLKADTKELTIEDMIKKKK
ncbi:TPA: TIGR00270 family protein [Candidatus Woesearchaeota archaeon]|nr:hypothetical protein QT06_C0001G0729 [archaeon GW2011_AR15]MBS3103486.1 TIGR00270 family protein [Candidatus Woesearchaeota archaeon]HAR39465.1 TIGR00270 family protein [Porphyromonadaceae bacterium]HIH41604.1 TIGR00270 family protein [Candidatus Woesearchaeota archaeon]